MRKNLQADVNSPDHGIVTYIVLVVLGYATVSPAKQQAVRGILSRLETELSANDSTFDLNEGVVIAIAHDLPFKPKFLEAMAGVCSELVEGFDLSYKGGIVVVPKHADTQGSDGNSDLDLAKMLAIGSSWQNTVYLVSKANALSVRDSQFRLLESSVSPVSDHAVFLALSPFPSPIYGNPVMALAALFPRARLGILSVVFAHDNEKFTLSELAHRLRMTPSSLQRELEALVQTEILLSNRTNSRSKYWVNVNSPIYDQLKVLFSTWGELTEAYLHQLGLHRDGDL